MAGRIRRVRNAVSRKSTAAFGSVIHPFSAKKAGRRGGIPIVRRLAGSPITVTKYSGRAAVGTLRLVPVAVGAGGKAAVGLGRMGKAAGKRLKLGAILKPVITIPLGAGKGVIKKTFNTGVDIGSEWIKGGTTGIATALWNMPGGKWALTGAAVLFIPGGKTLIFSKFGIGLLSLYGTAAGAKWGYREVKAKFLTRKWADRKTADHTVFGIVDAPGGGALLGAYNKVTGKFEFKKLEDAGIKPEDAKQLIEDAVAASHAEPGERDRDQEREIEGHEPEAGGPSSGIVDQFGRDITTSREEL